MDCAHVVVPEPSALAMSYYYSGNALWIIGYVLAFAIPLVVLFTGFSKKLSDFSFKVGKKRVGAIAVYIVLYTLLSSLVTFPLSIYSGYFREHTYGLSSQTLSKWFKDYAILLVLSLVVYIILAWVLYLLIRKSPKRWWLYSAIAGIGFCFVFLFVQPIWIDPLFDKFGPMQNKELEAKILQLAAKAGIEGGRVFEVNKSIDTHQVNAYMAGFGSTKRIVLWDTIIERLSEKELLFVMGHEMGHYVLHHMWWLLAQLGMILFVFSYLIYKIAPYLMHKFKNSFQLKHLQDIGSFPLLSVLFLFFYFISLPITNGVSRYVEHQADIFGLEITHDNKAAGEAFVILQENNLSNPRPGLLFKMFCSTHPPLAERVEFCNSYCPWKKEGK